MRTERWPGGIEYAVRVHDPDATSPFDNMRVLWHCSAPFKARQESPSPASAEAAREQQRIADEIAARYLAGAVT